MYRWHKEMVPKELMQDERREARRANHERYRIDAA